MGRAQARVARGRQSFGQPHGEALLPGQGLRQRRVQQPRARFCDEGGVSLVMVDEGKQLGEWAGLCKINEEGEATSVVRCSAACVTEFGEDTRALSVLLTYLKAQAPEDK